jgi:APA family basic amino acid/polyamine antiporter
VWYSDAMRPPTPLVRRLTRLDGLAIGVGAVIGTGIFRTTGEVLRGTGGFIGATAVWVGVGLVSAAGALVYAEMAARVPEAGGAYAYVREAYGRFPAFLDGGLDAFVSNPARQAASTAALGELIARLFGVDHPRLIATLVLLALVALTLPGVQAGAASQRIFTTAKLAAIAVVVVLALVPHRAAPAALDSSPLSLTVAVGAAWYSYIGWQDVALLAEELHAPERHIKAVLIGTVMITLVAYVAVHLAAYFGLGGFEPAAGAFPALDLARQVLGRSGETLMTCAIAASMLGGAAESLFIRPRVAFALARDELAPRPLSYVSAGGTPSVAMLVHAAIALALVVSGTFRALLALLVFVQAVTGLLEATSAFRLRARAPKFPGVPERPVAAVLFTLANLGLCALVAWQDPKQLAYAAGAVAILSAVYVLMKPRRGPAP